MIQLTFLKGIKHDYSPAKTFQLKSNGPTKVSDYSIGATFFHNTVSLPFDHSRLQAELEQRSSGGWFHIAGIPTPQLPQKVSRQKVNFQEIETQLLLTDIDKQTLPPDIAAQWLSPRPEHTVPVIRAMLSYLKLEPLAKAAFVYVLTSSQLNRKVLSAHLYQFLNQPVSLTDLRRWARLINRGSNSRVIDDAVYRSVQPVYISPPTCIGFHDPFPSGTRIGRGGGNLFVSFNDMTKLGFTMNKQPVPKTNLKQQYNDLAKTTSFTLKRSWLDTVEAYVGTEKGINEPGYRAIAQLVSEEGAESVQDNLDSYVTRFNQAVWSAIRKHGKRDGAAEREKYTEDKWRGDFETALRKDFGERADKLAGLVRKCIDEAIKTSSPTPILQRDNLRNLAKLQDRHPTKYLEIRSEIKSRTGKLVPIGALEKQVKLAGTGDVTRMGLDDPTKAIDVVMKRITLMRSLDGIDYLYWTDPDLPLKYRVVRVQSSLCATYVIGLLKRVSGERPFPSVRKMMQDAIDEMASATENIKSGVLIGRRVIATDDNIYYHVGQFDGEDTTIVINKTGVYYRKSTDLNVYWETTTNDLVPVPSTDEIRAVFGSDNPPFDKVLQYVKTNLRKFIGCTEQSLPNLVALAVSFFIRKPLIYLGVFNGFANTGKTFGSGVFKILLDPTGSDSSIGQVQTTLLPTKFDRDDFSIFMDNDIVAFDNVDHVSSRQQTIFSQLSTGSVTNRRVLYTQVMQRIALFQCIILNCNGNPIDQPDLKSRCIEIDFEHVRTAVDFNYREAFVRQAPILRYCFYRIAAEYMSQREQLAKLVSSINVRGLMVATIRTMFNGGISIARVAEEAAAKEVEDVADNVLFNMLIAWLDTHKHLSEIRLTSVERWNQFAGWVRANNGQEQTALVYVRNRPTEKKVTLNSAELPESQKSFDILMGSSAMYINSMSQWEYRKHRERAGATYQIYTNDIGDLF